MINNKLQDYYRAQRRFEYEKNVPIKSLNMTRKWHKIVISLLKMDLAVVGQKTKILSYKANVTKPTIFACTHIGRYDIEQAILSIGAPAYVFFGDPGNIYRTINGLLLKMNGVIYVDTNNKADRVASKNSPTIEKIMRRRYQENHTQYKTKKMNVVSICRLNTPRVIRFKCGLSKEFEMRIHPYDTLETVERTRFHTKEEVEQKDVSAHLNKLIPHKENAFLFREG